MAKYLDYTGLTYFKGKLDTIYGSSITLTGNNNIKLLSKNGTQLSTITISNASASTTTPGLMTQDQATKLAGITEGATKVEVSSTNGNILVDTAEVTVYTHPTATAKSAGIYKITTNATGHVTAATTPTAAEWRSALPAVSTSGSGLMSVDQNNKLAGIDTGAEVNVIEVVKVNNNALTVTNKAVNIDLSSYALKADVASALNYAGSVTTYSDLPTSTTAKKGDMYNVETEDTAHNIPANGNVVWNGTEWDVLGPLFTITSITNAEIDTLFA